MTEDFQRVRQSARASTMAAASRRLIAVVTTAWTTSTAGSWWMAATAEFGGAAPAARLRWLAVVVAVAAAAHVVLRSFLSSTVAPAVPLGLYVVVGAGAALIAWQADAFHRAWAGSRVVGRGSWARPRAQPKTQDPRPKTPHDGD